MADENDKRTVRIYIRVTPKEYKTIMKKTSESGLTASEFIRRSVMGQTIHAAPPADLNDLIREIKRVGSNLNQMLRKLNMAGISHPLELERVSKDLTSIIDILYQTFRPGKGDN